MQMLWNQIFMQAMCAIEVIRALTQFVWRGF